MALYRQIPLPFCISFFNADFEALKEKIQPCFPFESKSYTEAYQKHADQLVMLINWLLL